MLAVTMVAGSVSVPGAQVNAKEKTKEYVVLAKNDKGYNKAEEVCEETETEVTEELEENHILVGAMTETEAAELEQDKDIVIIEENIVFSACSSDKTKKEKVKDKADKKNKKDKKKSKGDASSEQWNLSAIHLTENCEQKDRIKVAILDSGISFDEDIDVLERFSIPEELEVENAMFDDSTGHGTGVAGVIAAKDNGMGIRGINPNAEICSIQILDENNQTTLSDLVAGICKAVEQDCQIINMSLGTSEDSEVLHEAVRYAYDEGVLMVAAAGNTDGGAVVFPAAYEEVLAVGATNAKGNKEEATSDGKEIF